MNTTTTTKSSADEISKLLQSRWMYLINYVDKVVYNVLGHNRLSSLSHCGLTQETGIIQTQPDPVMYCWPGSETRSKPLQSGQGRLSALLPWVVWLWRRARVSPCLVSFTDRAGETVVQFANFAHWWWSWLFLACEEFGRMVDNLFPACAFFFLFFFKVEIRSRTLIPLLRPGSIHSGSASSDDCGRAFPNKLRVSSFPDRFLRYTCTAV